MLQAKSAQLKYKVAGFVLSAEHTIGRRERHFLISQLCGCKSIALLNVLNCGGGDPTDDDDDNQSRGRDRERGQAKNVTHGSKGQRK